MKSVLAALAVALLAACGGTDSSSSTAPTCAPSGTWLMTLTKGQASSSVCNAISLSAEGDQVTSTSPSTFTFTAGTGSGAISYAGTLNTGTCAANVVGSTTLQLTDANGTPVTVTIADARNLTFTNNTATGSGTLTGSASAAAAGVPCTLTYTVSATRQ